MSGTLGAEQGAFSLRRWAVAMAGMALAAGLLTLGGAAAVTLVPAPAAAQEGDQLRRDDRRPDTFRRRGQRRRGHHCRGGRCRRRRHSVDALVVDGIGRRRGHYATITEALEDVRSGGTIFVRPRYGVEGGGLYRESLTIRYPVAIVGEVDFDTAPASYVRIEPVHGTECAVIATQGTVALENLDWVVPESDYDGQADCIRVVSGNVEIRNNYITGRREGAAIRVLSHASVIESNEITLAGTGIAVEIREPERRRRTGFAQSHAIEDNLIYHTVHGIVLAHEARHSVLNAPLYLSVSDNNVLGVQGTGIYAAHVYGLMIAKNALERIGYDGIMLVDSGGEIMGNTIAKCGRNGLTLDGLGRRSRIAGNIIQYCRGYGIYFESKSRARFKGNEAFGNGTCAGPRRRARRSGLDLARLCKD